MTAKDIKPNNPDDKADDTKADTDTEDRKAERKTQGARASH